MNEIMNINGVECYEKEGTAYLKLEAVARGLGFTQIAHSGNEVVRWERVDKYLHEIGIPTSGDDGKRIDFIPENVFYRLAMKAKNEVAEAFQAKIADEVIPSIRKYGVYASETTVEKMLADPDTAIQLLQQIKAERGKRKALEVANSALTVDKQIMQPKADYFDELVDRNLLTNFRETAKQLGVPPKKFVTFLLEHKYIYRDKKGKLQPYQPYTESGLFNLKECVNEKTGWGGTQTLITPKGRETFRLLFAGTPAHTC